MSADDLHVILLYNDDSYVKNGNPQELLAVQYTVTTAQYLYDALVGLGYRTEKIAVRGSLEELAQTLRARSPENTIIFNNCDGFDGSNQGAVQVVRLVEQMGFKHTGAPASSVELCIDKPRAKACLEKFNVPTPRSQVFQSPAGRFRLKYPAIVKPSEEDGSMGITLDSVVCTPQQLRKQVSVVLETYAEPVMVEEFIPGRELAVSMLGNDPLEVLPIAEEDYCTISNPLQRLLTYESKWDPQSPYYTEIISRVPATLSPEEQQAVCAAAEGSFRAVGLRDFGRVDIRFENGIPYVIDINELPDLAMDAGFWKSAQAAGMTYPQMVDRILKLALKREGWVP